ncbi:hypothetical protein [Sphaerisporangium perillae]|uniref:hypothetical protein n=1 Tax=Sphaerisporangium perillae TaxID=2935860 RepID=UPI002010A161|nr:hypothetical protein [Sphaerisporangium perillae]
MRVRSLLSAAALAAGLVVTPVAAGAADAATTATACQYKRVGNHWNCITPGAFCPAAAHGKYGYAKVTHRQYTCKYRSGDIRWRWLR